MREPCGGGSSTTDMLAKPIKSSIAVLPPPALPTALPGCPPAIRSSSPPVSDGWRMEDKIRYGAVQSLGCSMVWYRTARCYMVRYVTAWRGTVVDVAPWHQGRPQSTKHKAHSVQHTSHSAQHRVHVTQRTSHSTQHTAHSTQHTSYTILHTAHSTKHTIAYNTLPCLVQTVLTPSSNLHCHFGSHVGSHRPSDHQNLLERVEPHRHRPLVVHRASKGFLGRWQVASGRWQVASGKRQVASGKWQVTGVKR